MANVLLQSTDYDSQVISSVISKISTLLNSTANNTFNVRFYGAVGDGVTDDTVAINRAIVAALASTSAPNSRVFIYFPAGIYKITSTPWGYFSLKPIGLLGDGSNRSIIKVSTAVSGDIFAWSEAWFTGSGGSTSRTFSGDHSGVIIKGLKISGDRTTANRQNAFVFYDRNDCIYMHDVFVEYIKGNALASGIIKDTAFAYTRESTFSHVRAWYCGDVGVPVVDWQSAGTGDGTNEIDVYSMRIFAPFGTGVAHRSNGTTTSQAVIRVMRYHSLSIEGLQNGTTDADLFAIGDASFPGLVNNIVVRAGELLDGYPNRTCLKFDAVNSTMQPYQCVFEGNIGGGLPQSTGVNVQAGRLLFIKLWALYTGANTNIVVGPSTKVGSPIVFDGYGQTAGWTRDIDATSASRVFAPGALVTPLP